MPVTPEAAHLPDLGVPVFLTPESHADVVASAFGRRAVATRPAECLVRAIATDAEGTVLPNIAASLSS